MPERTTVVSETYEYETAECVHCGTEVALDDEIPESAMDDTAMSIIIGADNLTDLGDSIRVTLHSHTAALRHVCPECASNIYDYDGDPSAIEEIPDTIDIEAMKLAGTKEFRRKVAIFGVILAFFLWTWTHFFIYV